MSVHTPGEALGHLFLQAEGWKSHGGNLSLAPEAPPELERLLSLELIAPALSNLESHPQRSQCGSWPGATVSLGVSHSRSEVIGSGRSQHPAPEVSTPILRTPGSSLSGSQNITGPAGRGRRSRLPTHRPAPTENQEQWEEAGAGTQPESLRLQSTESG